MFLNRQLIYLHTRLLVQLVACDVATHDLERATQLTNLANYAVLLVLDQDILVAGVRDVRVNIELIVTYV